MTKYRVVKIESVVPRAFPYQIQYKGFFGWRDVKGEFSDFSFATAEEAIEVIETSEHRRKQTVVYPVDNPAEPGA